MRSSTTAECNVAKPDVCIVAESIRADVNKLPPVMFPVTTAAPDAAMSPMSMAPLVPENTSDDIVNVYRNAAKQMVNDPDFKAKATKALGPFPLIIGEEAGAIIKKAAIFSDNTKKQLNKVLKKNRFTYRVK